MLGVYCTLYICPRVLRLSFWQIHNPVAIDLLFHEAYHHYIKSLYPCSDGDVLILAGILMQINLGDFEQKKCQRYFAQK